MADNDAAIFLDLDNLVIGAREASLHFDVNLIIDGVKACTGGRIVLRRAYTGNLRQDRKLMKELGDAGFTTQSSPPLNNYGKNLIDMYMVVDAMETLVDSRQYRTYVLATGDRDFMPLVDNLRRRGKEVIGVGLRHTTSRTLTSLCDTYLYYEDLLPAAPLNEVELETLLRAAADDLLAGDEGVRASVLKERMIELSDGTFGLFQYADTSFTKFLGGYPAIVRLDKNHTTTYVHRASAAEAERDLYPRYRSVLKKKKLRIVPPELRLLMLSRLLELLSGGVVVVWSDLVDRLAAMETGSEMLAPSRNVANALLVVARKGGVIRTERANSLSAAPVTLALSGGASFQEAVICCDGSYLRAIRGLKEPYNLEQAALALYDSVDYVPYLRGVEAGLDPRPSAS